MVLLRFIESQNEWVQIDKSERTKDDLYLDGKLKQKLDFAKEQISKDFDVGGIVTGDEGSGKSTAASNIMLYMTNNKFDPRKDIIKSHEDALPVLMNIPDGSGVMFDEGYLLFYSGDALTKHQKNITKIFSIIRQKNLFFLIVAPSFFRLATYFALDRTRFLIKTYVKGSDRGFFTWWGQKGKAKLHRYGKAKHDYRTVRPSFFGRFSKCSLLDDTYKKIKRETLQAAFDEVRPVKKTIELKTDFKREFIKNNIHRKSSELAELLQLTPRRIRQLREEIRKDFPSEDEM